MVVARPSLTGSTTIATKCAGALSKWEDIDDPAEIEDAVQAFLPKDQPLRDETIHTLGEMMKVDLSKMSEDGELVNAIVSAATLRVVQQSQRASFAGANHRMSADDTLDIIKIVVVGNSGVGKTCLMLRFVKDEFVTSTRATIGMDFCTRQIAVNSLSTAETSTVQRLTCQVWDTAGQEQYQSLTATYYRKAGGVMIVYDSTSRDSFDALPKWLQQVEENADESIVKMIIGTKADGEVVVPEAEGKAFADKHGCLFDTTSAKTGDRVMRCFQSLSAHVLTATEAVDEKKEALWLNAPLPSEGKRMGCC